MERVLDGTGRPIVTRRGRADGAGRAATGAGRRWRAVSRSSTCRGARLARGGALAQELGERVVAVRVRHQRQRRGGRQRTRRSSPSLGAVDILVNNAGILSNAKSQATSYDEWRRVLAANLDAAFLWRRR